MYSVILEKGKGEHSPKFATLQELALLLENGDLLGLAEYYVGLYAEQADESKMVLTDAVFVALAALKSAS